MPDSSGVTIAGQVVTVLNNATLSQSFTAERAYVEVSALEDAADLKVTVIPVGLIVSPWDLDKRHSFVWDISVWIQQRLAPTLANFDPLMLLMEEVIDQLRGRRFDPSTAAVGIVARLESTPKIQDTRQLFSAVVTVSVQITR